ncbi:hypothetical protein P4O66_001896 [Electrophorus voltai]|uniref:Uncharacterized protein n=1 Tax=Electrophorus voltai TaxID=2609070 RepID=A0AAD8Z448_9TELE|nr:hypothetical protein P4O66_001896 [Electrophorus voltai]
MLSGAYTAPVRLRPCPDARVLGAEARSASRRDFSRESGETAAEFLKPGGRAGGSPCATLCRAESWEPWRKLAAASVNSTTPEAVVVRLSLCVRSTSLRSRRSCGIHETHNLSRFAQTGSTHSDTPGLLDACRGFRPIPSDGLRSQETMKAIKQENPAEASVPAEPINRLHPGRESINKLGAVLQLGPQRSQSDLARLRYDEAREHRQTALAQIFTSAMEVQHLQSALPRSPFLHIRVLAPTLQGRGSVSNGNPRAPWIPVTSPPPAASTLKTHVAGRAAVGFRRGVLKSGPADGPRQRCRAQRLPVRLLADGHTCRARCELPPLKPEPLARRKNNPALLFSSRDERGRARPSYLEVADVKETTLADSVQGDGVGQIPTLRTSRPVFQRPAHQDPCLNTQYIEIKRLKVVDKAPHPSSLAVSLNAGILRKAQGDHCTHVRGTGAGRPRTLALQTPGEGPIGWAAPLRLRASSSQQNWRLKPRGSHWHGCCITSVACYSEGCSEGRSEGYSDSSTGSNSQGSACFSESYSEDSVYCSEGYSEDSVYCSEGYSEDSVYCSEGYSEDSVYCSEGYSEDSVYCSEGYSEGSVYCSEGYREGSTCCSDGYIEDLIYCSESYSVDSIYCSERYSVDLVYCSEGYMRATVRTQHAAVRVAVKATVRAQTPLASAVVVTVRAAVKAYSCGCSEGYSGGYSESYGELCRHAPWNYSLEITGGSVKETDREGQKGSVTERETDRGRQTDNDRDRQRGRQTETDREGDSQIQTETDREADRQRETDREGDSQRQAETDREADRQRQTERETVRDRQRGRQTETDREGDRQRGRQTETDREGDSQRQAETDREADRQRQTERETVRDRQRQTERQTDRDRQRGRQSETDRDRQRGRQSETGRDRQRGRQTETDREGDSQRQAETDREADRQRQTERETVRDRQRQTERETVRDRQRQTERQTDRDRQRGRQAETDREADRQRQTETETVRDRQRQTERETVRDRQRQTERQTDRGRQTERETDRDRQRQTERQTDRDRQRQTERQTDRDRQRQTETDREGDSQRQTERQTDRDRQRGRQTERQTDRDRQRGRQSETGRDRQRGRQTETDREADRQRQTERETVRDRQRGRQTETDREGDRQRGRQTETDREGDSQRQAETDREADRQRQTERQTDRDRQRGRQTERGGAFVTSLPHWDDQVLLTPTEQGLQQNLDLLERYHPNWALTVNLKNPARFQGKRILLHVAELGVLGWAVSRWGAEDAAVRLTFTTEDTEPVAQHALAAHATPSADCFIYCLLTPRYACAPTAKRLGTVAREAGLNKSAATEAREAENRTKARASLYDIDLS